MAIVTQEVLGVLLIDIHSYIDVLSVLLIDAVTSVEPFQIILAERTLKYVAIVLKRDKRSNHQYKLTSTLMSLPYGLVLI